VKWILLVGGMEGVCLKALVLEDHRNDIWVFVEDIE